ncbi:hypothetical protein BDY19DRAFT_427370 [Irpex rosettiformis]|uniref:Uncharacterized protein n=1 Tax=Irpex rosettiformis TaxID=378272 RepID=A0ACB8UGR2_9APHY|nr:hypothetical protein BDY19DRAFT_427370 [Irpex rosettiformis]
MEDIRFVLEAPQNTRAHKKRPRLVTSCDNCRLKKIKCIQSAPMSVCEACSSARLPCRFRDREKYFAERSKLVSSSSKTSAAARQQIDMVMTTDVPPPQLAHNSSHPNGSVARSPPKRNTAYHPYHHISLSQQARSSSMPLVSPPPPPAPSPLFDPKYPDRPRSHFMLPYINAFFDNLSIWFPFIAFDETIKRFLMQDLPVLQANCIAALAVRYVDIAEVAEWGVSRAIDDYSYVAKSLANSALVEGPDMDTLHSLILLAWVEYNQQRQAEFIRYGQLAIHVSMTLGLSNERAIEMCGHSEYERTLFKNTRMCITVLESTLQSCQASPV